MRSGRNRFRVDIIEPPTTAGSRGKRTGESRTVYSGVYASVVMLSGLELIRAQKVCPEASVEVRIRYHADVRENHQIIWQGKTLNIGSINNVDGRNREQIILCTEVR